MADDSPVVQKPKLAQAFDRALAVPANGVVILQSAVVDADQDHRAVFSGDSASPKILVFKQVNTVDTEERSRYLLRARRAVLNKTFVLPYLRIEAAFAVLSREGSSPRRANREASPSKSALYGSA